MISDITYERHPPGFLAIGDGHRNIRALATGQPDPPDRGRPRDNDFRPALPGADLRFRGDKGNRSTAQVRHAEHRRSRLTKRIGKSHELDGQSRGLWL